MNDGPLYGFVDYHCHACESRCLNKWRNSETRYRECKRCHAVPVLDRGEPIVRLLPSLRWALHAALRDFDLTPKAAGDLVVRESRGSDERRRARMGDRREPNERRRGAAAARSHRSTGKTSQSELPL